MSSDPRVSLMIDNRTNDICDIHDATGITVLGRVDEIKKTPRSRFMNLYLKRHPHMKDFVTSPNCALLRIKVEKYVVVTRFQHVVEITPR